VGFVNDSSGNLNSSVGQWVNFYTTTTTTLPAVVPPKQTSYVINKSNVLQGKSLLATSVIIKGTNNLNKYYIVRNGTVWNIASNPVNGSNSLALSTSGLRGNYSTYSYVNDSAGNVNRSSVFWVNIYTTTTVTTTTTTTTTTTMAGSVIISVNNRTNTYFNGATVSVVAPNGSVLSNNTIGVSKPIVNTSVLYNTSNCKIIVSLPTNDKIVMNSFNFNKINKSFVVQESNLTGTKPVVKKVISNVIASNYSNGAVSTLVFNTNVSPNRLCVCSSWSFNTASCSASWACYDISAYAHKFYGTYLVVNVTHFSAYILGSSESLLIWDDTNDIQGEDIKHFENQSVGFFANYSNMTGSPIQGGGSYCQYMENSAGSWSAKVNMTYNSSNRFYYIYRAFGVKGTFNYNVTCASPSHNTLSVVDNFVISSISPQLQSIQWGQVYWWTAQVVAHSIHYGVYNTTLACTQTNLYYVEPVPINGFAKRVNASTDQTGNYKCQNTTQGAFKISNDGSVGINISAKLSNDPTGVVMKLSHANNGWQNSCAGACNAGSCNLSGSCLIINTSYRQIAYNMPANSSKEYWLWTDFVGAHGTVSPLKGNLTTNATKAVS
jgi:hypothetical protein